VFSGVVLGGDAKDDGKLCEAAAELGARRLDRLHWMRSDDAEGS
jgi:hypothetical protein